jgi:short-subunit dehydrogenase
MMMGMEGLCRTEWFQRRRNIKSAMGIWWWLIVFALVVVLSLALMQLVLLMLDFSSAIYKYGFMEEMDLAKRYGAGSWVIITGPSSGQGRRFAHEWAKRGFNLLLIGSVRTAKVQEELKELYPKIKTILIVKDFGRAYEDDFFDEIEKTIALKIPKDGISVLINSVGHRVAWAPFHEMPVHKIRDIIITGTMVQARLMYMMLPKLIERQKRTGFKSLIVSITAQCLHPNIGWGISLSNEISVPYLTIYEPTNAWGYYNMNSIIKEYEGQLDMLNITPGAVKTDNTRLALDDTVGAIDDVQYVRNIFRMMGQVQGETCAHWIHAASMYAINFAPWMKNRVLEKTGRKLAQSYMQLYQSNTHPNHSIPPPKTI